MAITPASGFVTPLSSLIIGLMAGVVCFLMVTEVKKRFGYDDSPAHLGCTARAGRWARSDRRLRHQHCQCGFQRCSGNPLPVGLVDGHGAQVVNQLLAIGITIALAVGGTLILLKIVDLLIGVRVSEEDEIQGLDLAQHGEDAYSSDLDLIPVEPPRDRQEPELRSSSAYSLLPVGEGWGKRALGCSNNQVARLPSPFGRRAGDEGLVSRPKPSPQPSPRGEGMKKVTAPPRRALQFEFAPHLRLE